MRWPRVSAALQFRVSLTPGVCMHESLPLSPPRVYPDGRVKLRFSQKIGRFRERLNDPQWRRYFKAICAGKLLGVMLLMAIIVGLTVVPSLLWGTAHAQQTAAAATTAPAVAPVMPADMIDMSKNPVIN